MSQETILHQGSQFEMGEVRCGPADPELAVLGPIRGWCISFPRLPVELRAQGRAGFLADSCTALMLAPGALLDRRPLSDSGSRCQWLVLSESLVDENWALGRHGAAGLRKSPDLALLEHRLFRRAAGQRPDDADLVELACSVVDSAMLARDPQSRARCDTRLADAAREMLARNPARVPRSGALAAALGVSVFHLCRSFKRATGQTIQEFSRRLRLDVALERLAEPDVDLAALAFDLGFSSHSHFTATFRRVFGLSPSAYRERRRRHRRAIA